MTADVERSVVHDPGCGGGACDCLVVEVTGRSESIVALRLAYRDQTLGGATLLTMGDLLLMVSAESYRTSVTGDWGAYHQMVVETLMRQAVRVADDRGMALATSTFESAELLAELGFTPAGTLMRRDARHGLRATPESGVEGDRVAWCVCGAERRAGKLSDAHAAVLAHVVEAQS